MGLAIGVSATDKPNVVLIMADDIGYECFGSYGSKQYKTPVLDKMAEEGMRFTHCYSQPLCTPSRVKIMTGMSNVRNYSNFSILNKEERTFGHMMKDAGYSTCIAGKWQLYGASHYKDTASKGGLPKEMGFDEYCVWQIRELGERFWGPNLNINGKLTQFEKNKYGPDICNDFVNSFIEKNKDKPFFIYYPMILVHSPFIPTPDSSNKKSKNRQKNFEDMVAYMDKLIGKTLLKLDELDLSRNTLFIFTGDNGTHPKIMSRLNGINIKGGKGKTTDAGTRVPMIGYWPGKISSGKVCDDLVDFNDFMPTIAQAAGAKLPEGVKLDGISFFPQLIGEKGTPRKAVYCYYWSRPKKKNTTASIYARDKRWKLYGDGKLYDVSKDVLEKSPVEGMPEIKERLQKVIDSMPKKGLKANKHGK